MEDDDGDVGRALTSCDSRAGAHNGGDGTPPDRTMRRDYEVTFTEARLGLTLKCQGQDGYDIYAAPRTVVKSTSETARHVQEGDVLLSVNGQDVLGLEFRDVRRLLKASERPIRLRFRAASMTAADDDDPCGDGGANSDVANASSSGTWSECTSEEAQEETGLSAFILPREAEEDQDDRESHLAVHSESFGDVDSTRTTENSSVMTDLTESEFLRSRHSSLLPSFLRRPFRRIDGVDHRSLELRVGWCPPAPRVDLMLESPRKAAIRAFWSVHPDAIAYQVQYARDRAVKVWKSWSGRKRRAPDSDRELMTIIYGLDFGKTYVVRLRYEIARPQPAVGEWSHPSLPLMTMEPSRLESLRVAYLRSTRN